MNPELSEAYLNLIESLLSCPSGEESAILEANEDLIDTEFVQALEAVAESYALRGEEMRADWLRDLASRLREALIPTYSHKEENLQAYLDFLLKVLQATSDSKGNPKIIYPLLAANTDKLDDIFVKVLQWWAPNTLAKAEVDTATSIAMDIGEFSILIEQFRLGNKASNMEIAIAGYEAVLTVFTREVFPQKWAMTQNNLGLAYSHRIGGDKANNLGKAINAYKLALTIYTREAFPQDWAMTQNNLAITYRNRIEGEKANNLEKAIDACKLALTIYTREAFPQDWATTQYNLAITYSDRIKGDKANNLEKAINAYELALTVRTREAFPQDWAMTQNNLAITYRDRIKGDKANNLERAINACELALNVFTREGFPQQWATMQNHLAIAYSDRIEGDKASNLERAINAYKLALTVRTREAFPQDWAATQNNLATTYRVRIEGDKVNNLEKAINACELALAVFTREGFPQQWATTQYNLAIAYRDRIEGDKANNLERAINAYELALTVRTREAFPQDWAAIQNNLATAYRDRINGERANNLKQAINAYELALTIYKRKAFPQNYAGTLFNLGILYQEQRLFTQAYNIFAQAITTVETLRKFIISGDEIKRKHAEEWNALYRCMVEVCLELKRDTEAIEYIERSKTRNLVELLFKNTSTVTQNNPDILQRISYSDIQNLLDSNTAIIQWYIFTDCFRVFVITRENPTPKIWCSTEEDLTKLINWIFSKYLINYYENKNKWRYQLDNQLKELTDILHIKEILDLLPSNCEKVILVPHRCIHSLTIHALPLSSNEYFIDKFPRGVGYAPSCKLLQLASNRSKQFSTQDSLNNNLFAIQNPTKDLVFTDIEVETIITGFSCHHILKHQQATAIALKQQPNVDLLRNAQFLHFSCHGYFDFNNPLQSFIKLADADVSPIPKDTLYSRYLQVDENHAIDLDKCLTSSDIFKLNFSQCRLVTLSACETGLVDFGDITDEYIGLPSGFICAGAACVVNTRWAVNDVSTALFMIKLYEILELRNYDISLCLKEVQQWLREFNQRALLEWLDSQMNITAENKRKIKERLDYYNPEEIPFKHPYFWAAFCAVGE